MLYHIFLMYGPSPQMCPGVYVGSLIPLSYDWVTRCLRMRRGTGHCHMHAYPVVPQLFQQLCPVVIFYIFSLTSFQQRQEVAQGGGAVPIPPGQVAWPPVHDFFF